MNSVYSRFWSGLVAIALAPALLAAEAPATSPTTNANTGFYGNRLAAKGKGIAVTLEEVENAYIGFKATSAGQGRPISEAMRPAIERQITERLVHRQLLMGKATEADQAKAKEEADKAFNAFKDRMSSESSFNRQLLAMGMTVETFRAKMYEETLSSLVADRLLRPGITLKAEDIKQFYETNIARFTEPAKLRISHILFLTQDPQQRPLTTAQKQTKLELAEKVLAHIKAGEDFAKLAQEYSEDPNSREKGGELRPLAESEMAPELAKAALALAVSNVSEVVTSKVGFHLVKLHEKMPSKVTPFTEAESDLREYLMRQEVQKQLPDYLKKLREEAGVVFMDL